MQEYKHLTPEDVDFFMEHGYLVVKGAFSREKAAAFTQDMWVRLGLDPDDRATWDRERIHMPYHTLEPVATFAPRVWEIMKELLGGEERIDPLASAWGDSFIVNLGTSTRGHSDLLPPTHTPASDPSSLAAFHPAELTNWHVDGDFFVHFLDSPEQALLVIPLFSDIAPGGGATYIAPEGIALTARYLAAHPEGVVPARGAFVPTTAAALTPTGAVLHLAQGSGAGECGLEKADGAWSHGAAARRCTRFVELTGQTGDVVLLHPLMLHAASPNALRVPRVITNPPVALRAPFCLARVDGDAYSLVERKTLRALGVDRLDFAQERARAGGVRRAVVPERVGVQARMAVVERERLRAARGGIAGA